MSVLTAVLDAVRRGVPAPHVARHLGIDPGLADLALEHWERVGVITPAGDLRLGCQSCAGVPGTVLPGTVLPGTVPPGAISPGAPAAGCTGCPFAR